MHVGVVHLPGVQEGEVLFSKDGYFVLSQTMVEMTFGVLIAPVVHFHRRFCDGFGNLQPSGEEL